MSNPFEISNHAAPASLSDVGELKAVRERLLARISEDSNVPALGVAVTKVVQLASSDDEAVRNLAHFIMSDVGLAQKILRIANAACFRSSSGNPVTTISKAIFMLGFDTVKTCALGMLLVDKISGNRASSVRAELTHALSASIFGRELARRGQFKDAEEAAVAALFRNMGRILVASHDHELYEKINALVREGMPMHQAVLRLLGCSFEMFAQSVMSQWEIPESIVQAQMPLPAGTLRPARNRQEWVQQVAAFSSDAAEMLSQGRSVEEAGAALLARYGKALEVDEASLKKWVETVTEEVDVVAGQAKLFRASAAAKTEQQAGQAAQQSAIAAEDNVDQTGLLTELMLTSEEEKDPTQVGARHPSGKPLNARELLMAGVQDAMEMMASGRCKVNDLLLLALETLYRGMGFRFATVCLRDIKTNQFRARIALGENNAARQAGFVFSADAARDLFHLAMTNDADLLISDATEAKIRDLIPVWHRALLPDARSFIVLPLVVQKRPLGLFYADRSLPAHEGVPSDETAMIKMLKGQVIAAMNSR